MTPRDSFVQQESEDRFNRATNRNKIQSCMEMLCIVAFVAAIFIGIAHAG